MYYYGGYSGNNSSCGCGNQGYTPYTTGYGYPMYGGNNGYGSGAAIVLVLFILLVIIIGARNCCCSSI